MPEYHSTPAPSSKRFLPPSTASASKSISHPSARKNIFQSSRSTTQPTSSTPSRGATPRFQTAPAGKDEIDTSFEDETESPIVSRRFGHTQRKDVIDEDEDTLPIQSPLLYRKKIVTPPAKKRKTSHPAQRPIEPITISSSPGSEIDDQGLRGQSSQASHSDDEDFEDIMIETPHVETLKTTRFRPSVPKCIEPPTLAKNAFKVESDGGHSAHLASGSLLPDVFSPSKRKGKREYIPGGMAELVRRWVLGIAAQDSVSISAAVPEMTITVSQARVDGSGRFSLVTDTTGNRWLFPEQQQKPGLEHRLDVTNISPGARVRLKGRATKWPLRSDFEELQDTTVGAYWELIEPG
ncbi:hypothetical protein H2204_000583 [Knufia peltigerae]|uniref:Uncharacterized protein n=1 Tax=Knufia peltigerae TaxID=1002370 RepID=A0AA39D3K4_9EURO|nr:hypothetical protein H2204_000583 [Knufia peltigerae]